MNYTEAGFDLTDISATKWKELLDSVGFLSYGVLIEDEYWIWRNGVDENNIIVTANNPITGQYFTGKRTIEFDYASYIGITGEPEFVTHVYQFILNNATYVKDSNFGTRIYI